MPTPLPTPHVPRQPAFPGTPAASHSAVMCLPEKILSPPLCLSSPPTCTNPVAPSLPWSQRPSCVTLILLPHHQQPSTAGRLLPSSDRSPSSPTALRRCCSLRIFCACDVCDTDAFIHQPLRLNIAVCRSPTPLLKAAVPRNTPAGLRHCRRERETERASSRVRCVVR